VRSGEPVGEELPFFLKPTRPPSWSSQPQENWQKERGTVVRLRLYCRRNGWEPWPLTAEVDITGEGPRTVTVP
jgi:hypothetical protein